MGSPEENWKMSRRILVPTDLSAASERSVRRAFALARSLRAEPVLLYAYGFPGPDEPSAFYGRASHAIHEQALVDLARQVADCGGQDLGPQLLVRNGPVTEVILETAKELGVDMIVLGRHTRHGGERWLQRSTGETVARAAGCPVMMVPRDVASPTPADSALTAP
jgi:nucleotide-binding universal stress UspA family protein